MILGALGSAFDAVGLLGQTSAVDELIFRRDAQSLYAEGVDDIFMAITWMSAIVFFVLMGLMTWWTIKYRRKPGVAAPRSTSHNTPLEITWTIIPSIIFIGLFFFGFKAYARLVMPEGNSTVHYLTAKKWGWDIMYANGSGSTETKMLGGREVPVFLFPEDSSIVLQMSSADVIHSFWVPDYRHKQDVFPNRYTSYVFHTETLDPTDRDDPSVNYPHREHWVFCAEYCGDLHSEMAAIIRVVPKSEYEKWLDSPYPDGMSFADIGEIVASTKGCFACHAKTEQAGAGPGWGNWYGAPHTYSDGSVIMADKAHFEESVLNSQAKIRQGYPGNMPNFAGAINDFELKALLAYMQTLSSNPIVEGDEDLRTVVPVAETDAGEGSNAPGADPAATPMGEQASAAGAAPADGE